MAIYAKAPEGPIGLTLSAAIHSQKDRVPPTEGMHAPFPFGDVTGVTITTCFRITQLIDAQGSTRQFIVAGTQQDQ